MEQKLPRWIDIGLLPVINILAAFIVAGVIIALIGENPFAALSVLVKGAFFYKGALGYTLFYATNFIFTGLAVAVAFHASLFNIGGEGQAMVGGLGLGLVALLLDPLLPPLLVVLIAIPAAVIFGAFWGVIPGWLQAKRGSHIVITTIMFNFIAASLMVWLLAGMLMAPGQMSPETRSFADGVALAQFHTLVSYVGLSVAKSPLNLSFIIALVACVGVWVLIWRTRLGYVIRATGHSERAVIYAGHSPAKIIIITMAISGGLAGLMALNEILGVQQRVILNFTSGYGFTGIAVALMGRNHPIGILLASLLFGALYQGGAELDFEFQTITREMVLMIQGLIILFSGALAYMFTPMVARVFASYISSSKGVD
ncbi:MAG: ABC transporter permease [Candidatus Puniceispirillaceae bacterium]|jgi:simple sugar transport system permease protein|nr:ABC transporter permease [Alphaproteobacteria bacterium]MDA7775734.1 ABC transporter permease [Alphaproteobacteria bacterium]HAD72871.1 sugar ABC transporter permease [Alphaproteobacteria bacterium]